MSRPPKVPFAIKILSQYGPAALKPFITKQKYFGPLVSRRVQANLRKRAIVDGTYGQFVPFKGGWDPKWDKPKKMYVIRPIKGHKNERTRDERASKITKAMQGMPERLEKYKQDAKDRKPKKDIASMFKRVEELSKTNKRYQE